MAAYELRLPAEQPARDGQQVRAGHVAAHAWCNARGLDRRRRIATHRLWTAING